MSDMTDVANTTPAERIAAFRSRHLIDLIQETHRNFGLIYRCGVDGLRVHSTRDGKWRHDTAEITALLDEEYGGAKAWTPAFSVSVTRDAMLPENCPSCGPGMRPPHYASPKCESGGYNHCSCSTCF